MKYWRGYLVAAIVAVCAWALNQFASAHSQLMDMVYPYMTRIIQNGLAQWSSTTALCLWQVLLLFLIALGLFTVILMVVFHWNPVQWFGWVLAAVSVVQLLSTGLYGMNMHTGSIADDVRIPNTEYTLTALEDAATYYLEQANACANQASRVGNTSFETLAQQAGDGFKDLTYNQLYPVFAGNLLPVKKLGWTDHYTKQGVTGMFVPLTGEAAVNPNVPFVGLPYAMCREMARRMSIAKYADANFAAYLACVSNDNKDFQYSGYLMAYRHCLNVLKAVDTTAGDAAAMRVEKKAGTKVRQDLEEYNEFLGKNGETPSQDTVNLLVNWHIQTVVIPSQQKEEEKVVLFDPLDESDERLSGLLPTTAAP